MKHIIPDFHWLILLFTWILTIFAGVMWSTNALNLLICFCDTNTLIQTDRTVARIFFCNENERKEMFEVQSTKIDAEDLPISHRTPANVGGQMHWKAFSDLITQVELWRHGALKHGVNSRWRTNQNLYMFDRKIVIFSYCIDEEEDFEWWKENKELVCWCHNLYLTNVNIHVIHSSTLYSCHIESV